MRKLLFSALIMITAAGCGDHADPRTEHPATHTDSTAEKHLIFDPLPDSSGYDSTMIIHRDVRVNEYFEFMDSLALRLNEKRADSIDEYVLVHANPWILDSLRSFDYYELMKTNRFVYDQTLLIALHKGSRLGIPDGTHTKAIRNKLSSTVIDVNIPAFHLRIYQQGDTLIDVPVRVGKNTRRYLEVNDRVTNLRTPLGSGEIVRIAKHPWHINPRTGKRYFGTVRDDGRYTKMPLIPWMEPTIDGRRQGALIHPTTNLNTLGKAYSNGCVGTSEADAWTIYYNAPLGTRVIYRYDLEEVTPTGDTLRYDDVYGLYAK